MEREQRTSIIDTLSSAFGLVNRWPALMAPPILLDLFFWFGPRLSIEQLMLNLADLLATQGESNQDVLTIVRQAAGQTDLFALLAIQAPSMVRLLNPTQTAFGTPRPVMLVTEPFAAIGLALLLVLTGLVIASIYLVPIARVVRDGQPGYRDVAVPVARTWLRQVALYALLIAGSLAVIVPLSVVATVLTLAGIPALLLVSALLQVVAIWLIVLLFFSVDAIALSEVGPVRAMWYSVNVVRRNVWSALGLMLLTVVIVAGLSQVFLWIGRVPLGVPVVIAANAYITTGLAAASLLFYRDRLARWQQQRRAAALNRVGPGAPR
ncbi:MAG: hypothetical protein IT340_04800 [Chloroflexi bacterium]|nr:hypothetical protein [Chloroflexota bacterium]